MFENEIFDSLGYSSEISFSKCNGFILLHCNVCCLSCLFVMMMALKGSGSIILQHWPVSSDFLLELSTHAQHYVLFQTHKKIFCNPPNLCGESEFHVNLEKNQNLLIFHCIYQGTTIHGKFSRMPFKIKSSETRRW